MRELHIVANVPLSASENAARFLLAEVIFFDGSVECYILVPAIADARSVEAPHAILARLPGDRVLCDGLHLPEVRADILRLVAAPALGKTGARLAGVVPVPLDYEDLESGIANSRLLASEKTNSLIAFGDRWFFKLYRKYERGRHPDLEVTRFLSAETTFQSAPRLAGALKLLDAQGEGVVGLLTETVPNQGDGWGFTVDAVERYFDRVLAACVDFSAGGGRRTGGLRTRAVQRAVPAFTLPSHTRLCGTSAARVAPAASRVSRKDP